jgi:hypothetical protein
VKKIWLGSKNFMSNVGTDILLGNLLNSLGKNQERVSRYNQGLRTQAHDLFHDFIVEFR